MQGGLCPRGILSYNISGGILSRGDFCPGGVLSGGDFVQGGLCPGFLPAIRYVMSSVSFRCQQDGVTRSVSCVIK